MKTWVNVKNSMPPKSGKYMCKLHAVKNICNEEEIICYYSKGSFEIHDRFGWYKAERVTHWRPLSEEEQED